MSDENIGRVFVRDTGKKTLVIIPAYNEAENIEKTVKDIIENAPECDFLVINDCSADDTEKICKDKGFDVLSLPVNLGIGGAVQTGYRYAAKHGYGRALQFDGDGQHPACYIARLSECMDEDGTIDMVIGSRFIEKDGFQSSKLRRFGIGYFTKLIKLLTGVKITDPTSGMRLVNRRLIELFAGDYPRDYPEPDSEVAILRKGYKVREVPVEMRERGGGKSSISIKAGFYYMIKVSFAIFNAWFSH